MPYGDFTNLPRKTVSDKVICDKAFNITKNPKYDGYQHGLTSMIHKYFDKKTAGLAVTRAQSEGLQSKTLATQAMQDKFRIGNKVLAEEIHKPIIKNIGKLKVDSSLMDNIWGGDLANMQSISKSNKGIRFLS